MPGLPLARRLGRLSCLLELGRAQLVLEVELGLELALEVAMGLRLTLVLVQRRRLCCPSAGSVVQMLLLRCTGLDGLLNPTSSCSGSACACPACSTRRQAACSTLVVVIRMLHHQATLIGIKASTGSTRIHWLPCCS